eukprot:CAMPEP_0175870426 /NCGR_PEP_ID=MMETSP0107_2-20121207/36551_1 /TAXON_ID=195067 ORGANISM="Goniomonas pacifica, Strain CCMP1869" /NCGR_SAMPLE_ID=MMETSP0107_2 /ASSEMBLY_ACC=CAM_ASM_000203 /LENGTH=38 /DNA_ID= /DNA_START= /DNA_END= /DNA_ORIENTATION=
MAIVRFDQGRVGVSSHVLVDGCFSFEPILVPENNSETA